MNLLNNRILLKPGTHFTGFKLLNGEVVSVDTLDGELKKEITAIANRKIDQNPELNAIRWGTVVAVPERLNNKMVHDNIDIPKAKEEYAHLTFYTPEIIPGDILYFHQLVGPVAKQNKHILPGSALHPNLEPDTDYWLVDYRPFRWLYAYVRNGELHPFGMNLIAEPVIKERISQHVLTTQDGSKEPLTAKVLHPGKNDHLKKGDIIFHQKWADISLTVDGKQYIVMDGLMDVLGVKKENAVIA